MRVTVYVLSYLLGYLSMYCTWDRVHKHWPLVHLVGLLVERMDVVGISRQNPKYIWSLTFLTNCFTGQAWPISSFPQTQLRVAGDWGVWAI